MGSPPAPLDFCSLQGQTDYLLAVQALYRQLQASWLTPVEILQPHYGRALAACILQRWREQVAGAAAAGLPEPPLLIYEVGGGTGTLARNMLVRLSWLAAALLGLGPCLVSQRPACCTALPAAQRCLCTCPRPTARSLPGLAAGAAPGRLPRLPLHLH